MYDNYNYPLGADDPSAPWNEPLDPEPKEFEIVISQCLSKSLKVLTQDYTKEYEEESGLTLTNTDDTEWKTVYEDEGHYTIDELLKIFQWLLNKVIDEDMLIFDMKDYCKHLIEECDNWYTNETEICE
jgi:hypothetical protein